ncbi:hypothetical protein CHLRE_09g399663v5 [Chlamydomonas reinhardtii]|uniref:PAS domain-containing protein n=1 Tax=Chlamydomonas reinhardtii TaxID=3055 RepID=A0A2K3DEV2_CHLRE|nr:uncharacterized protein CHLRE_09g399663v5 [Chlamydomonas reinhardtii]PNW79070.1 hypothetical protein CHLRE_09g399663v5 [Chlamydomonas reinhardtii]
MAPKDDDGASSERSGTSGADTASQGSSHKSDLKALRREKHGNEEEQDLLEQKKSFIEGVYSCMYTLVRQSALSSWKFAVLKIFLEGLMAFIVVFNPSMAAWVIDTNNPVWQIVRWVLWRSPIMRLYGYDTYIRVMYVMVAIVYLAVLGLVWLTLAMRKQEQSKWLKHAAVSLHVLFDLVFIMLYVSFFDYFVFTANCNFSAPVKDHVYFVGVECLKMPHILHMAVAIITAALFFCVTALLLVASSDLNPVSRGYLASPAAITRLRILAAKAFYVIVADDMQSWPKPQALFLAGAVGFIVYWNLKRVPFYRTYVNGVWTGIWFGVLYTALLLVYIAFGHHKSVDQRRVVTLWVLYGIFPVVVGTSVLSYWRARLALHPASKFEALEPGVKISKVHKFGDPMEVEVLARVMRQYNNDGDVTEEAAALGEKVVRAGMMVFPNNPTLLILYANFLLEVRKDGPAARTQLQLASKHSPTLLQRYQIFCTGEASKKLKDSQDGGMDLQAYIEFRRNFRAVLRVHKEVLLLQAELWQLMMRSVLRVSDVDKALEDLEAGSQRAHQVYKRVLERYPNNGKLLRCYGKFLEDVKHDPATAARVYGEASRNGGGDAILNLDLSAIQSAADKPDFLTSMSMEDDAVIVINAEGTIMMCSQAVNSVFGYAKNELEGMNVSLLMPQPFSQRHPSYLSRYVNGGEPHILDTVREVVGLHKDRFVFPLSLCVTKMSGTGTDSVFLGVARPMASNSLNVRAWIAPNGVFLCGDTQFASMCGIAESELVGCTLEGISLTAAVEVQQLLEQCRAASEVELASGVIRASLVLRHRYMDTVPVDVVVGIAGTDAQRIYVLDCTRADKATNVLVVDHHMRLRFASTGVSALLGYPARRLATMRLDQLLPAPYNTLHAKWTQNPPPNIPPTSCRAGKVVHLLNEAGSAVPVRIKVSAATGSGGGVNDANIGALNVVQIEKVSMEEQLEEKRWVLTADIRGRIRSVSRPDSELFDFAGADLVGCSLCDTIDIFAEWRERNGESQLQLLMLALLDKEHEMPGTSWRVRVRAPATVAAPHLPAVPGAPGVSKHSIASKSACLQVELHDAAEAGSAADGSEAAGNEGEGEGATLVAVTLWRRDLLSGVVELDEGLVVRRASPMTGLIVGVPAGAMMRKPIQKFLDMPIDIAWDDLVAQFARKGHGTKQRPALKGAASSRGTVSPVMPFIGPHPDTGTMRILTQGVSVLAPGGRPKITLTLHPDTTFAGAHANLMRVLHLDGGSQDGAAGGEATAGEHSAAAGNGAATAGADAQRQRSMRKSMSKKATDASRDEAPAAAGGNDTPTRAPAATSDEDGEDRDTNEQGTPKVGIVAEKGETAGETGDSDEDRPHSEDGSGGVSEDASYAGGDGSGSGSGDGGGRRGRRKPRVTNGSNCSRDLEAEDQARLHGKAASKSDFVAQWVRTLTKNTSGALDPSAPSRKPSLALGAPPGTPPAPVAAPPGGLGLELALAPIPEDGVEGMTQAAVAAAGRQAAQAQPGAIGGGYMKPPPFGRIGSMLGNSGLTMAGVQQVTALPMQQMQAGGGSGGGSEDDFGSGVGKGGKEDKAGGKGEDWEHGSEAASSASGSQAASGFTSVTDASGAGELVIDSRRGRLLKALQKLVCGPMLMEPLEKLRKHTYAIFLLMLITHVVTYVVVSNEIKSEHHDVNLVHRQALAMDRSQLIAVRAMMGAFCERPNVTLKVSVCANTLNYTIGKLQENIALMEAHHQYVYLGDNAAATTMLMDDVYNIWTSKSTATYNTFLDTSPPRIQAARAGVWVLGNRFIAAAREAVYWLPVIKEQYRLHRTFNFLVDNGIGPLFEVYAKSLDLLVNAAWKSVDRLRLTLIVLLVVEALVIQMSCLVYEWVLVQRLESSRLVAILAMLGLPGPILRQLATKEAKILEDDDDDESCDNDEEEHRHAQPAAATATRGGSGEADAVPGSGTQVQQPGVGGATARDMLAAGGRSRKQGMPAAVEDDDEAAAAPYGSLPPAAMKSVRHADSGDAAGGGANGADGAVARRQSRLLPESDPELMKVKKPAGAGAGAGAGAARTPAGGDVSEQKDDVSAASDSDDDGKPQNRGAKISSGGGMLDDGGARSRLVAGSGRVSGRRGAAARTMRGLRVNGKTLRPSFVNVTKFMLPFVAWNIALVIVYAISLVQLEGLQGPLASLNMASHIIYRYTRVRAIAFGYVSQDEDASRDIWRDMLATELRYFDSEYNALMYGGTPITQTSAVFNHPVPPSTFFSSAFATEFFRSKRCFRFDQEACLKPGDQYYEVTHNGLDVMVRRMLAEMRLLSEDADADVAYTSTRYLYMYHVGARDLYEGLQQAAQLFVDYSISRYNQVVDIHTILLICTIVGICAYMVLILWPHLARLKADAMRQSALLSHVPPELDVRAHVKAIFRRAQAGGGKRGGGGFRLLGGGGGRNAGVSGEMVAASGACAGGVGA